MPVHSTLLDDFASHDKYSTILTINDKRIDGVLGTQTQGGIIVGGDKSTEPWQCPFCELFLKKIPKYLNIKKSSF